MQRKAFQSQSVKHKKGGNKQLMLNTVILMGRLVADPVVRETAAGIKCQNFSLAVEEGKDQVSYFDISAFDNKAVELLHKADKITVSGRLHQRTYTGKDGKNRSAIEVIVGSIEFVDVKKPAEPVANAQ